MRRRLPVLFVLLGALLCGNAGAQWQPAWRGQRFFLGEVSDLIQYALSLAHNEPGGPSLHRKLYRYYLERQFRPLWVTQQGLSGDPIGMLDLIDREAAANGLDPENYRTAELRKLIDADGTDIGHLARLDMLLTDTALRYAHDLYDGAISPAVAGTGWRIHRPEVDFGELFLKARKGEGVEAWLEHMAPPQAGYRRLSQALLHYYRVAAQGGWERVDSGRILDVGAHGPRVLQVRRRLGLSTRHAGASQYDKPLKWAVAHFQERHGLPAHGLVDKATLAQMNVPVADRIEQILINMVRWRWMPRPMPERYLLVNMAGYDLRLIEDEKTVLKMKVIIGRDYRQTPVFASRVKGVVLNPHWYVPTTILREDLLPAIERNPGVLKAMHMEVVADLGNGGKVIDPHKVDWTKAEGPGFPYTLRQEPGPFNALGAYKFVLENSNGIYLHDTNHRRLFSRAVRAFSSGCIRLEKPAQLAADLLAGANGWTPKAIAKTVDSGASRRIALPEPLPIYFTYFTAWADEAGVVHFRDDVYERDRLLRNALERVNYLARSD